MFDLCCRLYHSWPEQTIHQLMHSFLSSLHLEFDCALLVCAVIVCIRYSRMQSRNAGKTVAVVANAAISRRIRRTRTRRRKGGEEGARARPRRIHSYRRCVVKRLGWSAPTADNAGARLLLRLPFLRIARAWGSRVCECMSVTAVLSPQRMFRNFHQPSSDTANRFFLSFKLLIFYAFLLNVLFLIKFVSGIIFILEASTCSCNFDPAIEHLELGIDLSQSSGSSPVSKTPSAIWSNSISYLFIQATNKF